MDPNMIYTAFKTTIPVQQQTTTRAPVKPSAPPPPPPPPPPAASAPASAPVAQMTQLLWNPSQAMVPHQTGMAMMPMPMPMPMQMPMQVPFHQHPQQQIMYIQNPGHSMGLPPPPSSVIVPSSSHNIQNFNNGHQFAGVHTHSQSPCYHGNIGSCVFCPPTNCSSCPQVHPHTYAVGEAMTLVRNHQFCTRFYITSPFTHYFQCSGCSSVQLPGSVHAKCRTCGMVLCEHCVSVGYDSNGDIRLIQQYWRERRGMYGMDVDENIYTPLKGHKHLEWEEVKKEHNNDRSACVGCAKVLRWGPGERWQCKGENSPGKKCDLVLCGTCRWLITVESVGHRIHRLRKWNSCHGRG